MSNTKTTLAAEARAKAGKGAARAVRRTGFIPGVIYGDNKEPSLISLLEKDLTQTMKKKGFFTQLCDLKVGGQTYLVVPRDVQLDPVNDRPVHADFLRVSEKTIIHVEVPVRVINEKSCPGILKGGVLNFVRHTIDVSCKATDIPDEFLIDMTGFELGSSVHIEDLKLGKGVKPTIQGNFTVVTLVAPTVQKVDETAAAAAPEAAAAAAAPAKGAAAPAKDAKGAAPAKGAAAPAKAAAPAAKGKK